MEEDRRRTTATRGINYNALVFPPEIDGYLWRPVIHGFWKQSGFDTYSWFDLIEMNSVIFVLEENKKRANEAAARQAERDRAR